MTTETRRTECTVSKGTLFMAIELGSQQWKLAFARGLGHRPRTRQTRRA